MSAIFSLLLAELWPKSDPLGIISRPAPAAAVVFTKDRLSIGVVFIIVLGLYFGPLGREIEVRDDKSKVIHC